MNFENELKKILSNGSPEDAFLFAVSFQKARRNEVFSIISECPKVSFKALKNIESAKNFPEIVISASTIPSQARVIIEDLPEYRNIEEVLKSAIDNSPYWADYYKAKLGLRKRWITTLAKTYSKRPDLSVLD